ncbi:ubiquitin-protein ligase 4, partial [Genlisea aurea]
IQASCYVTHFAMPFISALYLFSLNIIQVENVNILSNTEEEFSPTKITESLDATEVRADPLDREGNNSQTEVGLEMDSPKCSDFEVSPGKLDLYWEGKKLNNTLTLYQSIMELQTEKEHDSARYAYVWTHKHKIVYKRGKLMEQKHAMFSCDEPRLVSSCKIGAQFFSEMFLSLVDLEILGPTSEILFLLKTLEGINRFGFHFKSQEGFLPFSEARITDLHIIAQRSEVPESEFINMKLTEKLEQLLFDPRIVSAGAMPAWSTVLMAWCPFLFGFDARLKYFHLSAFHRSHISADSKTNDHAKGSSDGRLQAYGNLPRKKVVVHRDKILESAVEMMELRSRRRVVLEVEFNDEVGTGLGPTMEFYTLVCEEFQKSGIHMWRDDSFSHQSSEFPHTENPGSLPSSSFGLFPRPWSPSMITSNSPLLSEVLKKFTLFGQIMAKALEDRRLLDIPFSKAFYKLILGKELTVYDILSFDSSFGKVLLDLIDIVRGKKHLISVSDEKSSHLRVGLQSTDIEDLSLDFSLPGYPDYVLTPQSDSKMVSLDNLEEYISLVVNATLKSGIARQIEAFKSGFNQIFNISHLKVFREDELEHLLCGEAVMWN